MSKPTQDDINRTLWQACDTFRGVVDPSDYKNYILVFMFLKYLSDVWKDNLDQLKAQYGDDQERIDRKLKRMRFVLPENCNFEYIQSKKDDKNIGNIINTILTKIEDANGEKLRNVFRNIDFNSEAQLGKTIDRNRRLKNLIDDFSKKILDFRPSVIGTEDIIGNSYMYLIEKFASGAGKKGGEFYTPEAVSILLAKLLAPKSGNRICDPTCGSGSLLITVAEEVGSNNFALYGQESNGSTWALCKMNMFLHQKDAARIEWADTINNPQLVGEAQNSLMKFDIVVANPPFSLDKWGAENAKDDRFKRFTRGVPPKTKGDYAFILHMIETATPQTGKVGVIVPHGVLFRGSAEGKIRRKLIDENLLDAVIGLPAQLFYGTGIPAAILIFDKGKTTNDVFFVDASKTFKAGKKQNLLEAEHINTIIEAYQKRQEVDKLAYKAALSEIQENDYNLNIPRYVDTFEEELPVDLKAVQEEMETLTSQLKSSEQKMAEYLDELGLNF